MAETFKPVQKASGAADSRPDYHEQRQQPADVTYRAQREIENGGGPDLGKPDIASKEAVEDIDNDPSVKQP